MVRTLVSTFPSWYQDPRTFPAECLEERHASFSPSFGRTWVIYEPPAQFQGTAQTMKRDLEPGLGSV